MGLPIRMNGATSPHKKNTHLYWTEAGLVAESMSTTSSEQIRVIKTEAGLPSTKSLKTVIS